MKEFVLVVAGILKARRHILHGCTLGGEKMHWIRSAEAQTQWLTIPKLGRKCRNINALLVSKCVGCRAGSQISAL